MQFINGQLMAVAIDEDAKNATTEGVLGFQMHMGPPFKGAVPQRVVPEALTGLTSLRGDSRSHAAIMFTAPAARWPTARTRRRHDDNDEISVSHFEGLCPVGGAALRAVRE